MAITFEDSGKLGSSWTLEVKKDGVVVGLIRKNQEKYVFYEGAVIGPSSYPIFVNPDLEKLKAAIRQYV